MTELASLEMAEKIGARIAAGERTWLFLDYDGTLAEFAPTPEIIIPDPELISLIERLAARPDVLRIAILSGRGLESIRQLIPIHGVLLAGTYGIEFQTWAGENIRLVDFKTERPFLDQIKTQWAALIAGRQNFFLEDKRFSVALHARLVEDDEASKVITRAAEVARQVVGKGTFRILGGFKFLEIAPTIAEKGQSVSTLLKRFPFPGSRIIYLGDDDKDEDAFEVVIKNGGIPILVAEQDRLTKATLRLRNPAEVRLWLSTLAGALKTQPTPEVSKTTPEMDKSSTLTHQQH
jgi:trehalose 6-phosphate phosphatase